MTPVTDDMIACWRINYGLDTKSPEDAMRMWNDQFNGRAPPGAVAALGLALQHIDQLRAEIAARKEADTRSTIAAWDQIKRLQGEARVLRDLLAKAREVLGTIDVTAEEWNPMAALLDAIDAALDPTSREAQQMSITEASKEAL